MSRLKSRCVVLVNEHRKRPESLLDGLVRRGATPLVVEHPVQVMVQLAFDLRSVVVIDHPETVDKVPELLVAVRRYYPRVACWGYQAPRGGKRASLIRIDQSRTESQELNAAGDATARRRPTTTRQEGLRERLRGEPIPPEADANRPQPIAAIPSPTRQEEALDPIAKLPEPLLTSEELAMLIGTDFGQDIGPDQDQATENGTELELP